MVDDRLPVTVLTGYLGTGKTTPLNRILSGDHGRRYAVVVNEFGAIGVDHDLVVGASEALVEMSNGCVCCTVRGDLVRTLHALLARAGRRFDALVVETTGLADPGPVAQTFFVDPLLQARTTLDSVTTVVDAAHILSRLADSREAQEQVAFADQIVLNKSDLVPPAALAVIEARLRRANPLAPIHRARRSDVPLDRVLGRGGFDLARIVSLEPGFLDGVGEVDAGDAPHVHDAHCGHDCATSLPAVDHGHDDTIGSVALTASRPLDGEKVSAWLRTLVAARGADILRLKGILDVRGDARRYVVQAVHMLLEGEWQRPWTSTEPRSSRLVLIGRHLHAASLQAGLDGCAAAADG